MDLTINKINIFIIPPTLSLVIGYTLAGISVVKGKFKAENILLSLVCIWWATLSLLFMLHYIISDDNFLLKSERIVHFFYVYLPLINLIFFHQVLNIKNKNLEIICIIVSFIISITTQTSYYINGLNKYSWGNIAKGGIAFDIFALYGFIILVYGIVICFKKLKGEKNEIARRKIKYILFSINLIGLLTILNMPAINGINFYPMSNFMFVPLSILTYGVLRYKLMDIRSILHISFMWGIMSSLIIIPNAIIFYYVWPYLKLINPIMLFILIFFWFVINYIYIIKVQSKIDQLFNKRKFNLRRIEIGFIENISLLKNLDSLIDEFVQILKKSLLFKRIDLLIKSQDFNGFINLEKAHIIIDQDIHDWFIGANHIVEKNLVETDPYYTFIKDKLLKIFNNFACEYIAPLIQNYELIGLIFLSERINYKRLSSFEIKFIDGVRAALAISLSNSIMYHDLSELKDNLEEMVAARTEELQAAMEELESVNEMLTNANNELRTAQFIAERDMSMAVNVQASLYQKDPPLIKGWDIAIYFKPMAGVSGDLYDFYIKDSRLEGLGLFDVSGHGISSGLITMIAKSIFSRNFFQMSNEKLNSVIEKSNRDLISEIDTVDNYLTGIILRFKENIVEYVNAGHPDILFKKRDTGKVRLVNYKERDFKGMFLGFEEMNIPFEVLKFKIDNDDIILLYTDCLIESSNEQNEEYSLEGVMRSFEHAPQGSAQEILDFIINDFSNFITDKPLDDDLTLLVIRKTE